MAGRVLGIVTTKSVFQNDIAGFRFRIWHFASGLVSAGGNPLALVSGYGLFGFYMSFLAKKTNAREWSIEPDSLSGMIMAI